MKIAFRLNSDKAVEYANAHRKTAFNYANEMYRNEYFHLPADDDNWHCDPDLQPGYTDVTENFERDYWGPWKDKLASVQNDSSPVASHSSAKGNSDEQVFVNGEKVTTFNSFQEWVDKAKSRLGAFGRYDIVVCVDRFGNICHLGEDFVAAEKLESFPVTAYRLKRAVELTHKQ